MSLSEFNSSLQGRSYVEGGASPTKADAEKFLALFGENENVIAWLARMASLYAAERQELAASAKKPSTGRQ